MSEVIEPAGTRRNMAFCMAPIGGLRVVIALHTSVAPSTQEWNEWVVLLEEHGPSLQWDLARGPNLVFTDGGAPDTAQRTAVNTLVSQGKTLPPVALVTNSMMVRTMVRGFSIFNPRIKVFAPDGALAAITHLGLAKSDATEIFTTAINLEGRVLGAGAVQTLSEVKRFL